MSTSSEPPVASTSQLPPSPTPKLAGMEWWESIGSPKYVVAPMVDASELAWRILSRLHGATLVYTPMIHAALFSSDVHTQYQQAQFDTSPGSIEGVAPFDRPLVVQFCANDKDQWLKAAQKVVGRADAVDLNLGCPQGIAKKGHYGAFLMEEWDLINTMISHLHTHLSIPVIAKIRVFPTLERTLSYATHIYNSGAQLLTVHGRTRESKGRMAGLASWSKIASVRNSLPSSIPILANGGIPSAEEVEPCLKETNVQGVMSAEGNLYNPMIFNPSNAKGGREYRDSLPKEMKDALVKCDEMFEEGVEWDKDKAAYGPAVWLASQYLAIVRTVPVTKTAGSAVKAHLFKLFRPIWAKERHLDLREALGRAGGGKNATNEERVKGYQEVVDLMKQRILTDLEEGHLPPNSFRPLTHQEVVELYDGVIPYSHAQPYFRIAKDENPQLPTTTEGGLESATISSSTTTTTTTTTSTSAKRKLDDEVEEDVSAEPSDNKKSKPTLTLTSEEPSDVVRLERVPCSLTEGCVNQAATKCSRSACKSCCASFVRVGEEGDDGCEFHEEKSRKEKERAKASREHRRAKKGTTVGTE